MVGTRCNVNFGVRDSGKHHAMRNVCAPVSLPDGDRPRRAWTTSLCANARSAVRGFARIRTIAALRRSRKRPPRGSLSSGARSKFQRNRMSPPLSCLGFRAQHRRAPAHFARGDSKHATSHLVVQLRTAALRHRSAIAAQALVAESGCHPLPEVSREHPFVQGTQISKGVLRCGARVASGMRSMPARVAMGARSIRARVPERRCWRF